eukprot:sb/3467069/
MSSSKPDDDVVIIGNISLSGRVILKRTPPLIKQCEGELTRIISTKSLTLSHGPYSIFHNLVSNNCTHFSTGICTGAPTCKDHFDEACELAEYDCRIHKHQLCDGTRDCSFGKDESRRECDDDLMTTWNCSRRLGDHVTRRRIPKSWVCDGVQDCLDNEDEDTETLHKQCFTGNGKSVCVGRDEDCPVVFICPEEHTDTRYPTEKLCNNIEDCGGTERPLCRIAQDRQSTQSPQIPEIGNVNFLSYCLPGLSGPQNPWFECEKEKHSQNDAYGVDKVKLMVPKRSFDCRYKLVFGLKYQEQYARAFALQVNF